MEGFSEGYAFFEKNIGAALGAFSGGEYVDEVNSEIEKLVNNLNGFEGFNTASSQLKGDVAEFWHAGTFNINAVLKGSTHRAEVDRSHDFASVDISTNFGKDYGSKYYSTGAASAKAQSTSYLQAFKEYQAKGGQQSYEEFLQERSRSGADLNAAIYAEQYRLISKDQVEEATAWLKRKILEESVKRPEQVERYQNTLDMLSSKIEDGQGVESIELTKAEAEDMARIAKEGGITAKGLGLTTEELVNYQYILNQAFKAGLSAATVSLVLKVAPEIFKAVDYLIKNGEVDEKAFQKIGFAAVSGAGEGFIRGSVAAAITTACKSGLLGEVLKEVNPSVVGATTALVMSTMKNAFYVANGKMTNKELVNELVREMIVSSCSLIGGMISQAFIEIPVLGFMIGSFTGSMVGSFVYSCGYKAVLSFCVDSGFTLFGLVDQNYKLPEDVMEEIGIEIFNYDKIDIPRFEPDRFEVQRFENDAFMPDEIGITCLRRGVIGVNEVGYI